MSTERPIDRKNIKVGAVFANIVTIALGFFQFGIGMGSWNSISASFQCMYDWTDSEHTRFDSVINSVCIAGAMAGAIGCEPFIASHGKLKLMLRCNALLIVAICACMVN